MATSRHYSAYSRNAARLLGMQIRLCRKEKRWTETELASRAGISRATLQKIEKGDMSCKLGLVFEVAYLAGLELFRNDGESLDSKQERVNDKLLLLPKSIRERRQEVDDDF
ncbi:XRE family transcriptional regulator [Endozoicomonas montiporae]|uniref:XRE family transcriptional regulator n=2 Tax=Endozoicomonas montiporae TaxID=1027273 RepID=A0A081N0U3_9GAMM|nr:helix-turn-helix domain-containing protein [Endozoicomonas montiporae]AMO54548.1 helix-turn-helix motif protein [Endozoicomonas montiporae CL-33]KEQ12066.1 XRE family transcriptional regulator [Endozoicomonas montiporae]